MATSPHDTPNPPESGAATLAYARSYIDAGLVLVPLQPRTKGPTSRGWNHAARCWSRVEQLPPRWAGGLGLAHAYSRTCALDIDDLDAAASLLQPRGIPLMQAFKSPRTVGIDSGRPGRAKFIFRLPPDIDPLRTVRVSRGDDDARVAYELRCATADGLTVQDVLPPSIHPDTGQPYRWVGKGDWHRLPQLPGAVLAHWQSLIEALPAPATIDDDPLHHLPPRDQQVDELRDALAWIPADDYETWVSVGHALRAAGDVGYELWVEWSQTSPAWRDGDESRWDTFRPARTGWHAVFARAQRYGWINPRSAIGRAAARVAAPEPDRGSAERNPDSADSGDAPETGGGDWPPPMPVTTAWPGSELYCATVARQQFGGNVAWVQGMGWIDWTLAGWSAPSREPPHHRIQGLSGTLISRAGAMQSMAAKLPEGDSRREDQLAEAEQLMKASARMETAAGLSAVWRLLAPHCAIDPGLIDADPYLLGTPSGRVLDLRTGRARKARQTDWVTRRLSIDWDPEARCPRFEQFLRQISAPRPDDPVFGAAARPELQAGDPQWVTYMHRLLGYALLGEQREHVISICIGDGGNGKSTLFEVIGHVFGDYAAVPPKAVFAKARGAGGDTSTLVSDLEGVRLVYASEASEFDALNEDVLKQLSGADTMNARKLYEQSRNFKPVCTLVMYSNVVPSVSGLDHGIWRRLRFVPFDFRAVTPDHQLAKILRAEAAGILNWLIDGYREYEQFGLAAPFERAEALQERCKAEASPVREFWQRCTVTTASATLLVSEVYQRFARWYRDEIGPHPPGPRRFRVASEAIGMRIGRRGGSSTVLGAALLSEFEDGPNGPQEK